MLNIESRVKQEIERWTPVSGYESFYAVSSKGNIKRLDKGNILKNQTNNKGYLYVSLSALGVVKKVTVHKVVANSFLKLDGIVNHIDGNKQNNSLENLEIVSYSENNKHAYRTGLKKPSFNTGFGEKNAYFKGKVVGLNAKTGERVTLIGKTDMNNKGFKHQCVYACVNGKIPHYKGFIFTRVGV